MYNYSREFENLLQIIEQFENFCIPDAQALGEGLRVVAPNLGDVAPFYKEYNEKISGPLYDDDSLIRDATREKKSLEVAISELKLDKQYLACPDVFQMKLQDVQKLPESTKEALRKRIIEVRNNVVTFPEQAPLVYSDFHRILDGLFWQCRAEDGIGQPVGKIDASELLLRMLKARWVLRSCALELGNPPNPGNGRQIKSRDLLIVQRVSSNEQLVLRISKYGQEREIQAWARHPGDEWRQVQTIAEMEFPFYEVSQGRGDDGKWKFNYLPSFPQLVAMLRPPKMVRNKPVTPDYRSKIREMYENFENIKEQYYEDQENQVACTYIRLDIEDIEEAFTFLSGDDETSDMKVYISYEEDFNDVLHNIQCGVDNPGSPVDIDWSWLKLKEILDECDPEGLGYLTLPSTSRGHKNLHETLVWLKGAASGKRGFVAHNSLTREVRELLMEVAEVSWLKENKRQLEEQASVFVDIEAPTEFLQNLLQI